MSTIVGIDTNSQVWFEAEFN